MQALRTVALLAAFMPASCLLAHTSSERRFLTVSAKKKAAAAGGFGAAAPSTPKTKKVLTQCPTFKRRRRDQTSHSPRPAQKKKTEDDEPGLARPWDAPDDEVEETRAQKRGSKKIGKRGAGAAPQPSGGMSAGVKLN